MHLGSKLGVVLTAAIAALLAGASPAFAQEDRVALISTSAAAHAAKTPSRDPGPLEFNWNFGVSLREGSRRFLEESSLDRQFDEAALAGRFEWCEVESPNPLDLIVGFPDLVVQGAADAANSLCHDADRYSMIDESRRALLPRLIGAVAVGRIERPFDDLTSQVAARETKYFAHFDDSSMATIAYEAGLEDLDSTQFYHDQKKIFTHALGRVYLGRYAAPFDERLRRDAFDPARWEAVDYFAGPCLIAGYLYLRGFNRSFSLGDLGCRFSVKPFERINHHLGKSDDYLISAASLEVGVGGFPVKAIYSAGVLNGSFATDFVGLGVTIPIALKAVRLSQKEPESDR